MKETKEHPTKIDELLSIVDTSSLTKPELKNLKKYLTLSLYMPISKPITQRELYSAIKTYSDKIGKADLKIIELDKQKLDVQFEEQQLKAERKIMREKEEHKRKSQQPPDKVLFYNKKSKKHDTNKREPLGTKNGTRRKGGYDVYENSTQEFNNPNDTLESKNPPIENQELSLYLELKERVESNNYKNFPLTKSQSEKLLILIECRYDFNKASKKLDIKPSSLERTYYRILKSPKVSGLKKILPS